MIRFLFSILLLASSLLILFRPPTFELWKLSVAVTEWGHFFAPFNFVLASIWWQKKGFSRISGTICLISALIFFIPFFQALSVSKNLAKNLEDHFGPVSFRTKSPLDLVALFKGVSFEEAKVETLVYATKNQQDLTLDFYKPKPGAAKAPCVLVIHGGSWRSGDSRQFSDLNHYLASKGVAVASINYRLAPDFPFPAAYEDVTDAISYLKNKSSTLEIDPDNLFLLGRSAGAELALLAAYKLKDPNIRGVVAYYGPTNLVLSYQNPGNPRVIDTYPILISYLGEGAPEVNQNYFEASPINFVEKNSPPTLLIHGQRDELVWHKQSDVLNDKLQQLGVRHYLLKFPWATHGCDYFFSGSCGQLSTFAVDYFMTRLSH